MVAAVVLTACALAPAAVQAAFPGTNGKLAFSSARDGFPADSDLYTMAGDGAAQTRITSFDGDELFPSWSKDGTKIVFERNPGLRPDVWVANADGSNATQLTQDAAGDYHPAWAPSGAKIVFASDRDDAQGTSDLFVMNADGSAEAEHHEHAGGQRGLSELVARRHEARLLARRRHLHRERGRDVARRADRDPGGRRRARLVAGRQPDRVPQRLWLQ